MYLIATYLLVAAAVKKKNWGICIASTQPFRAALGPESRVPGNTAMSAHVLLLLTVNSKSEQKVNSLPPLGFEPAIFGMLAHLSDRSAKSHPHKIKVSCVQRVHRTDHLWSLMSHLAVILAKLGHCAVSKS
jgi:hypothetical protein